MGATFDSEGARMEQDVTKQKYYRTFSLYFVAFGIIVAIVTSFINYQLNFTNIEEKFGERALNEVDFSRCYLQRFVSKTENIISSVQQNSSIKQYVETGSLDEKKRVADLFVALTTSHANVMHLRYLDATGHEKIRIDRDFMEQKVSIIPDSLLQDKSSRYYFTETAILHESEFWHSNVDLNIEHGEIEKLHRAC